jgi:RNA polymerase sigma-70 factor (ECF subfamily)
MGKKLKKEIRINNLAAFDDLYKQYFNALYRFNYTLVGNAEEALDSTQETFIKLYRHLDTGKEIRDPKAWIYRVAANTCYNHLKRKKLFRHIIKENLQPDITPGDMEENLMKKQEIKLLRKAIDQLPARDRMILTLYKNGFSTLEIAGVIRVKKNSVGKILARSVEKLSKLIKQGDAR